MRETTKMRGADEGDEGGDDENKGRRRRGRRQRGETFFWMILVNAKFIVLARGANPTPYSQSSSPSPQSIPYSREVLDDT